MTVLLCLAYVCKGALRIYVAIAFSYPMGRDVTGIYQEFGLENAKPWKTLMATTTKLDKDDQGKCEGIKVYRGIIGSLLYLTTSRPDIMFSVCLCARFQFYPKESHLIAVKCSIKYLKGTINMGLWYSKTN